jgi:SPP1 family predicted phage head-tail adaptor
MTNEVTHKITLRYFDGLTTQHRITFDTRVFNISQVLNTAERNLETVVLALEEVT